MRYCRRISDRFPGDYIDGSGDSRRTEKCRTTSTHHLHPVHHVGRKLFDSVHARQGAEYRTGIYKNLGILSVQTIDPDLLESAVLAIVLDTDSRLERKSLSYGSGIGPVICVHSDHIHKSRRHTSGRFASGCGNYHPVYLDEVFLKSKIDLI